MDIRSVLAGGGPLLFDGGMGTCYAALPGRAESRCEQANLDHPEEVLAIHRAYLEAGARCIKTNTFTLSADLAAAAAPEAEALLRAGGRLALEAARSRDAFVFGDIGPAPQGKELSPAQIYIRQAEQYLALGISHILAETLSSDEGLPELARYLKEHCPESFLIASFAVGADGFTKDGIRGQELFRRAAATAGVDAAGFNCVSGPHHLLEYIQSVDPGDTVLSVMPTAGYPTVLGRRVVFQDRPEYFAGQMARIVQAGAVIVGGCCGTTPEHIARTAAALKTPLPPLMTVRDRRPARQEPPARRPEKNALADKLAAGRRVVAVELDPPEDDSPGFFLEGARTLRDAGADAVTIADCPVGRPRADSSLLACRLKRELGVEPLPHMTCRDRNLNATKALLLGLSMEGVHNVLLVTGDPIPTESRDEVKSVFNFNSRKLLRYVADLNRHSLTTPFQMFAALNLNARNFAAQLKMAQEKEAAGAAGFLTQPVHSREALENLKLARQTLRGWILGGIFPIVSHRNACFLNNEIAGMKVCGELMALYEGLDREAAEDLAVRVSAVIARETAPWIDGYYLMTPFRRVGLMTRILEELRPLCGQEGRAEP